MAPAIAASRARSEAFQRKKAERRRRMVIRLVSAETREPPVVRGPDDRPPVVRLAGPSPVPVVTGRNYLSNRARGLALLKAPLPSAGKGSGVRAPLRPAGGSPCPTPRPP